MIWNETEVRGYWKEYLTDFELWLHVKKWNWNVSSQENMMEKKL